MNKFILLILVSLFVVRNANADILVFSPNGKYISKPDLATAATDADTIGKTVVITSALSAIQSNISSASIHEWPANRKLKIEFGGSIANTTKFSFAPGATVDIGLYQVFTGSGAITGLSEARPEWWGNSSNTVQLALSNKGKVLLSPNTTYTTSAITVDAGCNSILGNNSILDFSGLTSGNAISFVNTKKGNPYYQTGNTLEGFHVKGSNAHVIGINYSSAVEPGVSHISVYKVAVYGFGTGLYFGDNAYLINHIGCDVHSNTIGIKTKNNTTINGGEKLAFIGCTIFNNEINVSINNGGANISLTNCSLDYATSVQIQITDGQILMSGCNIEAGAVPVLSQRPNTFVTFSDCLIIQQASSGETPLITVGGFVTFTGGRIIANDGTTTVVSAPSGTRFTLIGTHVQHSGNTNFAVTNSSYFIWEANTPYLKSSAGLASGDVTSLSGIYSSGAQVVGVNPSTWTSTGFTGGGLVVFRDNTNGKAALVLFDGANMTPIVISSAIPGFLVQYLNDLQIKASATGTFSVTFLQTNHS